MLKYGHITFRVKSLFSETVFNQLFPSTATRCPIGNDGPEMEGKEQM